MLIFAEPPVIFYMYSYGIVLSHTIFFWLLKNALNLHVYIHSKSKCLTHVIIPWMVDMPLVVDLSDVLWEKQD